MGMSPSQDRARYRSGCSKNPETNCPVHQSARSFDRTPVGRLPGNLRPARRFPLRPGWLQECRSCRSAGVAEYITGRLTKNMVEVRARWQTRVAAPTPEPELRNLKSFSSRSLTLGP